MKDAREGGLYKHQSYGGDTTPGLPTYLGPLPRPASRSMSEIPADVMEAAMAAFNAPAEQGDEVLPIARAILAERKAWQNLLADPAALRVNVLCGIVRLPEGLVWLHDTNGPVAEKVAAERERCAAIAEREAAEFHTDGETGRARACLVVMDAIRKGAA